MGGFVMAFLAQTGASVAFPFIDPTNSDSVPTGAPLGTELPSTDSQGLRNQLRLTNPAAAGNPSAWTITPRLTMQEEFTDNALEVTSPRVFDAVTVFAPGIAILADTARLKLNFDYSPTLLLHAVEGPLNVMTQQLNATGLVTVVPDLAFVDIRAMSGVQSRLGSTTGLGTLGSTNAGGAAGGPGTSGYQPGQGLNRNNEVQTSSFGISPYLLRQFGDYGTGKIGVSANASRYSTINGFFASPFPAGGTNGESLLSTEQIAHFVSGEFLEKFQDTIDVDLMQTRSQSDAVTGTAGSTLTTVPGTSYTSQRQTFSNQISYALSHTFTLLASFGEQNITYSVGGFQNINGPIWSLGFTYTPSPDSSVTVTYGRQDGANAFNASGHFVVGGRSFFTLSYSNTVGTQLENLQNQLNNSSVGAFGNLISSVTGGPTLIASNGIGVQNGVFRFNTFNASWTTSWLRDTLQASLTWSEQTNVTPSLGLSSITFDPSTGAIILNTVPISVAGSAIDFSTIGVNWTHELSPDLTLNSSASYSFIKRSSSIGNDGSLSTAVGLQYVLSPSTTLTARYSFFDRVSKIPGYSLYENLLLLGLTKQF
jgi:Putative beta-barrel porin 2